MFYRILKDRVYDYSDFKYADDCKEIEGCTYDDYLGYCKTGVFKYIVVDGILVENKNYKLELEEKEKERVANLRCTKRVLALVLKELGVSYTNLQALIATNEDAQLEWDLCVELERSNPLLDILGAELGISSTTIDKIFKYANGEIGKEDFDETDIVKGGISNG